MKRKPHSTSLVLLLVCIFTFWWGISVLSQRDLRGSLEVTGQSTPVVVSEVSQDGTYTFSGTYMPASTCDSFGSGISYSAANGGHVSVILVTDSSNTACAQAAGINSADPFTVSIKLAAAPQFDGVILNNATIPSKLVMGN